MKEPMSQEEFTRSVFDRVCKLETHIINLIVPIQTITEILRNPNQIQSLVDALNRPLKVDDSNLSSLLIQFTIAMKTFGDKIQKFKEVSKDFDFSQTLGEIKYIGKRLNEIELKLKNIEQDGIKQNIEFEFKVDGCEFVKKQNSIPKIKLIEKPNELLKNVLNTLQERESKAVIHRLGLLGETPETYVAIGKKFKISRDRASQIYKRAIRKLKHSSRIELVKKTGNKDLINAVGC